MSDLDSTASEDHHDPLIQAIARTPRVTPFVGTERYRVCRCLGEGGFGVVYEVEDRELGRRLALKTLKPRTESSGADIRRLKGEFRSAADLVHPNLVGLHELSSDGTRWFFTMDLVRGGDFLEYVCGKSAAAYAHTAREPSEPPRRRDTSGILSEPRLRAALRQLVAGLSALHEAGVVHRDIKPTNVLVESDGRVVILDFGLAGSELSFDADSSLRHAGTPVYMAPEQAAGSPVTPAADWYSVGVMLYEALTGHLPFDGSSHLRIAHAKWMSEPVPPSEHARVPADLEKLCLALLRRDPEARPDAGAILEMLGDALSLGGDVRRAEVAASFVGRQQELETMRAAQAAVRQGEPRLLRVFGQPGVGKSALIDRFLDEIRERGDSCVLAARCHERESVPFKAFDGIVDALVRYLRALPRNEASALMPRDIHLMAQLFPVLDTVPAVRDVPRRQRQLPDPREARQHAFSAIKEMIARIADKQPLVMVIDDLQWGDVDSARLLTQLVAPPERPSLLLLLAYRAEEAEHSPTLREMLRVLEEAGDCGSEIALGPLAEGDAERLAAHLLGHGDRVGGAARAVAQRGEGHPLFMAELARELELCDAGGLSTPTLIDILWQRVVRLSEASRALLETVAVAGQPLASALCFQAAGLNAGAVDALRALRAEQLVRADDRGAINVFHDRIRDAILMRADAGTRRMRHLSLARTLEREPQCDLEVLAHHYDGAEEYEHAARYAVRAGDSAMQALAFDRAAVLYQMAIDRSARGAPPSSELHEKLGDALLNAGCSPAAGRAYLAAAEHAEGDHATDLTRRAAEHLLSCGERELGYQALVRAFDAVGLRLPGTTRSSNLETLYHTILARLGGFRFREKQESGMARASLLRLDVLHSGVKAAATNDVALGCALSARFSRMALKSGEPRRAALGLIEASYGLVAFQRARPPAMDVLLDRAEQISTRISDPNIGGRALLSRAWTHFSFSDWHAAADLSERAADFISTQCIGMANEQHSASWMAATSLARAGEFARARSIAERLLLGAIERGDPVAQKAARVSALAPLSLAAGDPEQSQHLLDRSRGDDRCLMVVHKADGAAALAMYRGRPREAVEAWREHWSKIEEYGLLMVPSCSLDAAASLGTALCIRPESRRDIRRAARLARSVRRWKFPRAAAVSARLRAYLAAHDGRLDKAIELLSEAAAHYEEASMPLLALACRYRHGQVVGGERGAAEIDAAGRELRARGIAELDRWVGMLLPPIATGQLMA